MNHRHHDGDRHDKIRIIDSMQYTRSNIQITNSIPIVDLVCFTFFFLHILQAKNEKPVSKADAWDYACLIGAKYIETSSRANVSIILIRILGH